MRNHEQHLSDEELVLASDNEFGAKAAKLRAHLEGCVQCRNRAAEFEHVIARLAQAQRNSLDSEFPSIASPRAMLRTRMAEMSAYDANRRAPFGRFLRGALGAAALVTVMAAFGMLALRHSGPPAESAPLASIDQSLLPNRDLTPGAVRTAPFQEICALPHEEVVKDVSPSLRRAVLEEYGIPAAQADDYEVDYLITPGLGGDDDIRNLWPEPYHAATWNAHVKDALEERLHEMVCSHQLDLAVAQKAIATNWIAAYQKYVRVAPAKG
jgi:hypothetical protein